MLEYVDRLRVRMRVTWVVAIIFQGCGRKFEKVTNKVSKTELEVAYDRKDNTAVVRSNANVVMSFSLPNPTSLEAVKKAAEEFDFHGSENEGHDKWFAMMVGKPSDEKRKECKQISSEIPPQDANSASVTQTTNGDIRADLKRENQNVFSVRAMRKEKEGICIEEFGPLAKDPRLITPLVQTYDGFIIALLFPDSKKSDASNPAASDPEAINALQTSV